MMLRPKNQPCRLDKMAAPIRIAIRTSQIDGRDWIEKYTILYKFEDSKEEKKKSDTIEITFKIGEKSSSALFELIASLPAITAGEITGSTVELLSMIEIENWRIGLVPVVVKLELFVPEILGK